MPTTGGQVGQGISVQDASGIPPESPIRKGRICTAEDPFFGEDVPKPEGDPYDELLKPLLEQDSRRCNAWKDEVQNILIFAGLFSAVITAFIVESYQKLRPDPSDQIVLLLSRISDQLTNSPNGSATPLVPSVNSQFTPSHSDVRVNIFWFISLVLSLTVALIGIITLQWLREHQRYDGILRPQTAFGVFNARSEGLRRWYVPQIFAVLPLLLQGALVLFFVGLIDFLFNIRIEVAIPVAVSLGIPILFLVATTFLPTLQLYVMEFPHLLSVNYGVPAPCPYKSPQSLIGRRIAILSQTFFRMCAYTFAAMYAPFVGITRSFVTSEKPFYGKSAPFHGNVDQGFKQFGAMLPRTSGDWVSLDIDWLTVRTSYAIIVRTPDAFHDAHREDPGLACGSLARSSGFYDCVQGMLLSPFSGSDNSCGALHHCGETLVENQCKGWDLDLGYGVAGNLEPQKILMRGRCMAIMAILAPQNCLPTTYLRTKPGKMLPDGKVLRNAYRAAIMDLTQPYIMGSEVLRNISQRWMESHTRLITPYLLENTQQFFECTSIDVVPKRPKLVGHVIFYRGKIELHCPVWMDNMSKQWTLILINIIQISLELTASTFGAPHVCSSSPPCGTGDVKNDNVKDLMQYILLFQVPEDIKDTLRLLQRYCTSTPDPIHDLPYVLVIACAYVGAVAVAGCWGGVVEFYTLLETVSSICGYQTNNLSLGIYYADFRRWDGLEPALTYIRDNQIQMISNTPKHESLLEISDSPISHRKIKAPENV